MIHNKDDVKAVIEELEVSDHMDIVKYIDVWSNGVSIRRYQGQGKGNNRSPENGYKKMVAILVEVEEEGLF
ncbi:phosphate starvation protein [Bacillus phage SWEP1]|nr:phosphate starvation protein [Bacillus phage SWEP1]